MMEKTKRKGREERRVKRVNIASVGDGRGGECECVCDCVCVFAVYARSMMRASGIREYQQSSIRRGEKKSGRRWSYLYLSGR